jgi:hypothetical protein
MIIEYGTYNLLRKRSVHTGHLNVRSVKTSDLGKNSFTWDKRIFFCVYYYHCEKSIVNCVKGLQLVIITICYFSEALVTQTGTVKKENSSTAITFFFNFNYFNFRTVHFVLCLGITNKCISSYQFLISLSCCYIFRQPCAILGELVRTF